VLADWPVEKIFMHIIIGDTRGKLVPTLKQLNWGRMACENNPDPYEHERWGFDCKVFPAWKEIGKPVGLTQDDWAILWDAGDFAQRLAWCRENVNSDPYMAVCPDIPGGGLESLKWSLMFREDLPNDWPWYLAVQDGMKPEDLEECLHLFAGIFLGGSDRFKGQANLWCKFAHAMGVKFHYGRAGTLWKVKHAFQVGADSCDSSFPLWTAERFRKFVQAVGSLRIQEDFYAN
jgi:hypothetical protein